MSDQRTHRWGSGRLISTSLRGFWQPPSSLDAADPSIPNLPLESPDEAPADGVFHGGFFTAPQDVSGIREACGYAVAFASAALFAVVAGTDTVGAADYTVGTHGAAIADSQSHGKVWGTPPQLMPVVASEVPRHTVIAAPEHLDDARARVWGYSPEPTVSPDETVGRTLAAAPEHHDTGSAWVYGNPPASVAAGTDTRIAGTLIAAAEHLDYGRAVLFKIEPPAAPDTVELFWRNFYVEQDNPEQLMAGQVWGSPPDSVAAGTDVAIARTVIAAQEHHPIGSASVRGTAPESVPPGTDTIGAANYTTGTHGAALAAMQWQGRIWHGMPPEVVAGDTGIARTLTAAGEHLDFGAAWVKTTPAGLMPVQVPPPRTLVAAQEHHPIGEASVWGTAVEAVPGTDIAIARIWIAAEPFYEPVQYGRIATPNADLIPPAVVVPDTGGEAWWPDCDKPKKKAKRRTRERDPLDESRDRVARKKRITEAVKDALYPQPVKPVTVKQARAIVEQAISQIPAAVTPDVADAFAALNQAQRAIEAVRPLAIKAAQQRAVEELARRAIEAMHDRAYGAVIALTADILIDILAELLNAILLDLLKELENET